MARPEAVAVAGYYPSPPELVPVIAKLVRVAPAPSYAIVDPCAGEGAAVLALAKHVFFPPLVPDVVSTRIDVSLWACEMESNRFKALDATRGKHENPIAYARMHMAKGDAFRLVWSAVDPSIPSQHKKGASLLFLNPPYIDPKQGAQEHRFLERFASTLIDGGVLLFLVPYKSLAASASTLAREFKIAACYRFPGRHFEAYSQVVLVGVKRPTLLVEAPAVRARVIAWSKDPESIPELPENPAPCVTVPGVEEYKGGFGQWAIAPVDLTALRARVRPWHSTDRGGKLAPLAGIMPDRPVDELLCPTYPVAMPPRAAHIAAGIASGIFNGARIAPDDPSTGLPEILVKGTFTRDFVTVDEKEDKYGEIIGEVQVQQPSLVVTVLDLRALRYHTIKSDTKITGTSEVGEMTTADLLATYGRGLMKVMLAQCPVLHDPSDPAHVIPLAPLKRPLYTAQAHAVMGSVKLLGGLPVRLPANGRARMKALRAERRKRTGKAVFVLGEIGSGKSQIALATMTTIKARRILALCPPHLLDGWRDQIAAVLDGARAVVLSSLLDVDRLALDDSPGTVVAILSRETAKLGHAWEGVSPLCPKCGTPVPEGDLAKTRARCASQRVSPGTEGARTAFMLAELLLAAFPGEPLIGSIFRSRIARGMVRPTPAPSADVLNPPDLAAERAATIWAEHRTSPILRTIVLRLLDRMVRSTGDLRPIVDVLLLLLNAVANDDLTVFAAEELYEGTIHDPGEYGNGNTMRDYAREIALLLTPGGDLQNDLYDRLFKLGLNRTSFAYSASAGWSGWQTARGMLANGEKPETYSLRAFDFTDAGEFTYAEHPRGSAASAFAALELLVKHSSWRTSHPCGEPLYQAAAELVSEEGDVVQRVKRYPLASYIAKRHPRLFDGLIIDEGHEYSGEGSAQGFAAHRLVALRMPTMILTGSVMNGYARSLFANQWAVDPEFRREFSRDEIAVFERRYGYIKQFVDFRTGAKETAVEKGTVTDRVEGGAKTIGSAPGVLPLFILRYLLAISVTVHKRDLALELPVHRDVVVKIQLDEEMRARALDLQRKLMTAIKRDRFGKLAGKLWGQMSELPSYYDRATIDTGNTDDGSYVCSYPESVGGMVVCRAEPFPASYISPKERWMLDTIKESLATGRRVLVYGHHEVVLPRLARLIEAELVWKKGACPVLLAKKVPAKKRQEWIDQKVIATNRPVLVVNPFAVQTGLNNLVHFQRALWMENPSCNPIVKRQADGRIDRIGKTGVTESIFPVYEETSQEVAHKLLLHKVGVSMATDGLDAESALSAAGVGSGGAFEALSIGRQLFELLSGAA